MKQPATAALVGIAIAGTVLVIGYTVLRKLFADPCGNDVVAEYLSPDKEMKLVVFQRDCGATTGFSTQASLVVRDATLPNGRGNLFVADTDHGMAPSGAGGGPELRVQWEGPKRLLLHHHEKARIFKAERRVSSIEVRYDTFQ